jgi:pectate lyase
MKKYLLLFVFITSGLSVLCAQDTLIIQETDAIGLCTYYGTIMNNLANTSNGKYIDIGYNVGAYISYEISVPADGVYSFLWRYAFNGTARDARLLINGTRTGDTVYFPSTGSSSVWQLSTPVNAFLVAGNNKIRIEALYGTSNSGGLGNIDYFMVLGNAPLPTTCSPQYAISVSTNNIAWGTVACDPVQTLYDKNTEVTLRAHANPGYFFQCWTGEETGSDTAHKFNVKQDVHAVARFLPNGIQQDSASMGYVSVEDDKGTPYLVFGGALGDIIEATTIGEIKAYMSDANPHVVKFSGEFVGPDTITVKSDKTLLGIGNNAHLRNIEVRLNQARNVILRNIAFSHVHPKDAIGINDKSKNILIDHCDLYSQRGDNDGNGIPDEETDKDWYDGLLDIKNESSFITVAWTKFHDHYKVCLMASNDSAKVDSVARITFHHNYFYNCSSRLPMIRFGKAHIFNNYYKDSHEAVDSRMGAWVRVEGNYFENVTRAVFDRGPVVSGYVLGKKQIIDNYFGSSIVDSIPVCDLVVPYPYTLDPTAEVPIIVAGNVGTSVQEENHSLKPETFALEQNYPNPFNPTTVIRYQLPIKSKVNIKIFDVLGREVATLAKKEELAGDHSVQWDASNFTSGVYFYRLTASGFSHTKKMLLLK